MTEEEFNEDWHTDQPIAPGSGWILLGCVLFGIAFWSTVLYLILS